MGESMNESADELTGRMSSWYQTEIGIHAAWSLEPCRIINGGHEGKCRDRLYAWLKNSISSRSEKFLGSMTGFVLPDMRGHKKYLNLRCRASYTIFESHFWKKWDLSEIRNFLNLEFFHNGYGHSATTSNGSSWQGYFLLFSNRK